MNSKGKFFRFVRYQITSRHRNVALLLYFGTTIATLYFIRIVASGINASMADVKPETELPYSWQNRFCRSTQPIFDIGPGRNKSVFKSQYGQDIWIKRNILQALDLASSSNPKTFLEFGARNGLDHSNSYYFDTMEGYDGILIEGADQDFLQLKQVRERKGVSTIHGLVCSHSEVNQKKTFYSLSGGLAGLGRVQSEESAAEISHMMRDAISKNKTFGKRTIELQCISLNNVLRENRITGLTLLSIDCEGCELEVLCDFDFGQVEVWVMLVERPGDCTYTNNLMKFIEGKGFIAMNWESSDVIFVNQKIFKVLMTS